MPLFDSLFNDHASQVLTDLFGTSVVAWSAGRERVTAIRLKTGQQFSDAVFEVYDAMRDERTGVSNVIKARLWLPLTARPGQQEQWLIVLFDGRQLEMTCMHFGQQQGGLQALELVQVEVTRFERTALT